MPLFLLPLLAGAKSFFSALIGFCSKPPGSWLAAAAAVAVALWCYGQHEFNKGVASVAVRQQVAAVRLIAHDSKINVSIGDVVVRGLQIVQANTSRIEQEIPVHVTPAIDAAYPVPLGFVRMFNDASHGPVPGPAAGSDADPSGVPLSQVARAHAGSESIVDTCRVDLAAWWSWYDQHKAAREAGN